MQIKDSLEISRFHNSAKRIKQEIEKLQMLALTFGSDMQLTIKKEGDKFVAITRTDEAVLKQLNGSKMNLEGVFKVKWDGQEKVKPLDILSNGRIFPEGVLSIEREEKKYYLDFRLPIQIKFSQTYNAKLKRLQEPKKPEEKGA